MNRYQGAASDHRGDVESEQDISVEGSCVLQREVGFASPATKFLDGRNSQIVAACYYGCRVGVQELSR